VVQFWSVTNTGLWLLAYEKVRGEEFFQRFVQTSSKQYRLLWDLMKDEKKFLHKLIFNFCSPAIGSDGAFL